MSPCIHSAHQVTIYCNTLNHQAMDHVLDNARFCNYAFEFLFTIWPLNDNHQSTFIQSAHQECHFGSHCWDPSSPSTEVLVQYSCLHMINSCVILITRMTTRFMFGNNIIILDLTIPILPSTPTCKWPDHQIVQKSHQLWYLVNHQYVWCLVCKIMLAYLSLAVKNALFSIPVSSQEHRMQNYV